MEPSDNWGLEALEARTMLDAASRQLPKLERRKLERQQRMAHSLVGTPNYIAPEVLLKAGQYTMERAK